MTSDLDGITDRVKEFYERHNYPSLGEKLMLRGARLLSSYFDRPGKILFPGCGTGHGTVSMAKIRSDLEVFGLDLSEPSSEKQGNSPRRTMSPLSSSKRTI
jgi:ubiquinone/menaquinone biosynthesis C-methylase UbiE